MAGGGKNPPAPTPDLAALRLSGGVRPTWDLRAIIVSVVAFFLLFGWVTAFWGRVGLLLPPPFDNWHYVFFRALTRWSAGAQEMLRGGDSMAIYAGIEAFVLGLLVPAAMLHWWFRRSPADFGLRKPDALGWRWTLVAVALSVPIGIVVTAFAPPNGNALAYAVRMISMIPEHFLICGVGVALLLPQHKLTPARSPAVPFAILGATALFVAAHAGARPQEVAISVPLGAIFAGMTWGTGSIWPALFVHWSLNLAPLVLRAAFG